MAKGNRIVNEFQDNVWLDVFYNSVGTYVNVINRDLSEIYKPEPLSKYIKIGGGYAFKTAQYKKEGVPVIRISDFNNERIDISNCIFYDEDDSLSKYELNEGDIIICLTGGTIGKLGIVQEGLGKLYLNQRVGRFDILDENIFEKEYVYWIARSVQDTIKQLAWGAAIPNVSPKQIEQLNFSIPKIDEQRAIIEFLNDLKSNTIQEKEYFNQNIENHIIELHQTNINLKLATKEITQQLDLIKNLRQAFLREAMQGVLVSNETSDNKTGADLLAEIQAEKAQLVKDKKIKKPKPLAPITEDEIPFAIPENWTWCRLGKICTTITDGFHNTPPKVEKGYPYIAASHVKPNNIDWAGCHFVEEKYHRELYNKANPQKGEVLIVNIGAGSGTPAIIDVDYEFSFKNTAILKFNQSLTNNKMLFYYFILNRESIYDNLTKGGLQPFLSLKILNDIVYPLPPLEIQERIVAKLDELMSVCDALETQVKQSQHTNEQLLQQVLREALGASSVHQEIEAVKQPMQINPNNNQVKSTEVSDIHLQIAAIAYMMESNLGLNYGNVTLQKTVYNTNYFNPKLFSKSYEFTNHNYGTFSKELAVDISNNPFLTTLKVGKDKEAFKIDEKKKGEVLDFLSAKENKHFVRQINQLLDIYKLPFIKRETFKIELFNTVLKAHVDTNSYDLELIYDFMKNWTIQQENYQTKADKFSIEDTTKMLELIQSIKIN